MNPAHLLIDALAAGLVLIGLRTRNSPVHSQEVADNARPDLRIGTTVSAGTTGTEAATHTNALPEASGDGEPVMK